MKYQTINFDHLPGLEGFSDQLLTNHFTLYNGYVENTNRLVDMLSDMVKKGETKTPEYAELNRRFAWEFNGMRLHEYYFSSLTKDAPTLDQSSNLFEKITEVFGSFENWEKDFRGVGALRGIGWAILYYEPVGDQLFNVWVDEHDMGHLSGASPLLVLDVFEHAFITDYGLDRGDYIEAFFKSIDWTTVSRRLAVACSQNTELGAKGVELALFNASAGSR